MRTHGLYADGRTYLLPSGWVPVSEDALVQAAGCARAAFEDGVVERARAYYDPDSGYAGNLLTTTEPNHPDRIEAADLLAVSTLSMLIKPRTVREVLGPTPKRAAVHRFLSSIPTDLPLTALDAEDAGGGALLDTMASLQAELRTVPRPGSNKWVFAAKMGARKRHLLFPVRDSVVCRLLNSGAKLRKEGIGNFATDVQVFAYLMTDTVITARLKALRHDLEAAGDATRLELSDLRLLDVVLWTEGLRAGYGRRSVDQA